jgi:hypothetical protein
MFRSPRSIRTFLLMAAIGAVPSAHAIDWEVRDVEHPVMGAIKVAVPTAGVVTPVNDLKIVSAAFVSCEKSTRRIAIELANSLESDPQGGLKPAETPRLVCNPEAVRGAPVRGNEIAVTWKTNELGDGLARDLDPAALSRCGALDIVQVISLPAAAATKTQRISMVLAPRGPGLAQVFDACGPRATQAQAAPPPDTVVVPPGWRLARTVANGKTNVRSAPALDAPVSAQLPPNARILVQKATAPWWKVQPTKGSTFAGYIREDRFTPLD